MLPKILAKSLAAKIVHKRGKRIRMRRETLENHMTTFMVAFPYLIAFVVIVILVIAIVCFIRCKKRRDRKKCYRKSSSNQEQETTPRKYKKRKCKKHSDHDIPPENQPQLYKLNNQEPEQIDLISNDENESHCSNEENGPRRSIYIDHEKNNENQNSNSPAAPKIDPSSQS